MSNRESGARPELHDTFDPMRAEWRHRTAAMMLLCVLTAPRVETWNRLAVVLAARLTLRERCELAFAALAGLPREARERTFAALGPADPDPFDSPLWREVAREYRLKRALQEQAARHAR